MALFALTLNGMVVDTSPVTFPVHPNLQWTTDVGTMSQQPQFGWSANRARTGEWIFNVPPPPPPPPKLSPTQTVQAAFSAAVVAGIRISSSSTPALDGTYGMDKATLSRVVAEQMHISSTRMFSTGGSTRFWLDQVGNPHLFPSIAEFTAFANATMQHEETLTAALSTALTTGRWVPQSGAATIP